MSGHLEKGWNVSGKSSIEWTDATWNPVRGCTKISPGCKNCYAETFAERWRGVAGHPYEQGFDLRLVPEKLEEPLKWKKPRRVFVNSMSDLFQDGVPFEFIDRVYAIMALAPQHTFQILTKRPERMLEYFSAPNLYERILRVADQEIRPKYRHLGSIGISNPALNPPKWIWLGTSVENQEYADKRIPLLLRTPAAVRFVSYEPALGPVQFHSDWTDRWYCADCGTKRLRDWCSFCAIKARPCAALDWVIVGGESGPGARPFNIQWSRDLVRQCKAAGVACFVKQMGGNAQERNDRIADVWYYADGSDMDTDALDGDSYRYQGAPVRLKLKSKKGGDPAEWPEDLRVREFPEVSR